MTRGAKNRISVAVGVVLLLIACAASVYAETVIQHITTPAWGGGYPDYLAKRAEQFAATHPGVRIEIVSGNREKALTMILGGTPPDVLDFTLADGGSMAIDGLLMDISPFIQRDKIRTDYYPPFVWSYLSMQNGGIWGFPMDIIMVPTVYNVSMFEDVGLRTPAQLGESWTWDTLVSSAKKLNYDKDGDGVIDRYALGNGSGLASRYTFVHQAGGQLFDNYKNPSKSLLNTPEVARGIQWFSDLFNVEGVFPISAMGSWTDVATQVSAMTLSSTLAVIDIINQNGVKGDIAPQPLGPANRACNTNLNSMQIVKGAPNPELAWEWIKFVAYDADSISAFTTSTGRLPSYMPILQRYNTYVINPPANLMKTVMSMAAEPAAFHGPLGNKAKEITTLVNERLLVPARQGRPVSVADTLAELHVIAEQILSATN